MCTSGKPLALVSVFFAFLQISLRLLLCRFTLQAESLLGLWPVQSLTDTQELSFKWQGSQEVVDEIEALGHYVDALAAADMQGGTNFFLLVALEAPVSDSALTVLARDHAAFLRTTAMSAEQLPISWGSHVPTLPAGALGAPVSDSAGSQTSLGATVFDSAGSQGSTDLDDDDDEVESLTDLDDDDDDDDVQPLADVTDVQLLADVPQGVAEGQAQSLTDLDDDDDEVQSLADFASKKLP